MFRFESREVERSLRPILLAQRHAARLHFLANFLVGLLRFGRRQPLGELLFDALPSRHLPDMRTINLLANLANFGRRGCPLKLRRHPRRGLFCYPKREIPEDIAHMRGEDFGFVKVLSAVGAEQDFGACRYLGLVPWPVALVRALRGGICRLLRSPSLLVIVFHSGRYPPSGRCR